MVMFPTGRHYIVTRKEKFCRIIPLEFVFSYFRVILKLLHIIAKYRSGFVLV